MKDVFGLAFGVRCSEGRYDISSSRVGSESFDNKPLIDRT
jgi:hypothetical protein